MGLLLVRARFRDRPPKENVIRAELLRQMGSTAGLDGYEVKDDIVQLTMSMDTVLRAYLLKILLDLGGKELAPSTHRPRESHLPDYVRKPWHDWPWWKRAGIRLGLSSAVRPPGPGSIE